METRDVLSGIMNPVLFFVYVNHLLSGVSSQFGEFANDYKVYLHCDAGMVRLIE